jgi:hypothetical protein
MTTSRPVPHIDPWQPDDLSFQCMSQLHGSVQQGLQFLICWSSATAMSLEQTTNLQASEALSPPANTTADIHWAAARSPAVLTAKQRRRTIVIQRFLHQRISLPTLLIIMLFDV